MLLKKAIKSENEEEEEKGQRRNESEAKVRGKRRGEEIHQHDWGKCMRMRALFGGEEKEMAGEWTEEEKAMCIGGIGGGYGAKGSAPSRIR